MGGGGKGEVLLPNHQQWHAKWKLSRNMYTMRTRFCTFGSDLYARSVLFNYVSASELRPKLIKSALLVGYAYCRHALFDEMESRPDEWSWVRLRGRHDAALRRVAEYLGARPENLVSEHKPEGGGPSCEYPTSIGTT